MKKPSVKILSKNYLKLSQVLGYRKRLKEEEDGYAAHLDVQVDTNEENLFI